MLELARRVTLGVNVAQLLELEGAFERQRIGGAAAEIEHVARARQAMGDLFELRLELERLGDQAGRRDEFADQRPLLGFAHRAARPRQSDRQTGDDGELAGEGLGRGDADLRPGERWRSGVGEAGDRGGRHVDDADRLGPLRLGVAQRSQRVGGLARLRDDDRQTVRLDRGLAIAIFGGDVDLDRQAGEALDPIFADQPRHIGGAAGDDRQARNRPRIDRPGERPQALRAEIDVMGERVADDFRLLVNLLGHEVAIIALLGEQAAGGAVNDAALDDAVVGVAENCALARHDDPVALFEIGDAIGEGSERQRVGAEIHRPVAIADRERRALTRADQEVVFALEQIDQREGAAQPLQRRADGLGRRLAGGEFVLDQKGGDFGVGLGRKPVALGDQLLAQRAEVLDDAVVHDREARAGVRMGVGLARLAMRRPAGVADADCPRQRRLVELGLEVLELALGAQAGEPALLERRDPGRIIAAVFEPLQRRHDVGRDRLDP